MIDIISVVNYSEDEISRLRSKSDEPVHRIFCIDCSGSMSSDLPLIRTQLKNKIASSIRPQDFMSLLWFSGRGECGTIFEHVNINDLQDISRIHTAIDRYLHTVGLTGFVEPIRLCKTIAQKYPQTTQVFFLSDGGENQWPIDVCEEAFRELELPLVIVEYQYYCDREFLQRLAIITNGSSVFNEDFERYNESFNTYMTNVVSSNKRQIQSEQDVFYLENKEIIVVKSQNGNVFLPEHIVEIYRITNQPFVFPTDERVINDPMVKLVYLSIALGLKMKNNDLIQHSISVLGDVFITRMYSSCFSKQDYSRLYEHVINCIEHPTEFAFKDGVDLSFQPKDDAFNVVECLQLISQDEKSRFYPYNNQFKYKRISKNIEDDSGVIFVPNRELGCKLQLVYHQSRANISLNCVVYGHEVDATGDIKPVSNFRNYAILKDGIKNVNILPMSMSEQTFLKLQTEECIGNQEQWSANKVFYVNITNLPVVNRLYGKVQLDATNFCSQHVRLTHKKAVQKYLKGIIKHLKKAQEAQEEQDDEEQDDSSVKRKKFDPTVVRDFYVANELQVKIAKCSSLPTVNDKLLTKLNKNSKLTVTEQMMLPIHQQFASVAPTPLELNTLQQQTTQVNQQLLTWCETKLKESQEEIHHLTTYLEQAKMAILVANVWFTNVSSDVNTFDVDVDNVNYSVKIEINDSKVYME